jgi:hypothetical protein
MLLRSLWSRFAKLWDDHLFLNWAIYISSIILILSVIASMYVQRSNVSSYYNTHGQSIVEKAYAKDKN